MVVICVLTALSLCCWVGVLLTRGRFWWPGPWLRVTTAVAADPAAQGWPSVAVVVPARDEVDVLARTLPALMAQDYPGVFRIIVVDDASSDGTGELARDLAAAAPSGVTVTVIPGLPTPAGWAGKVWALAQGVDALGQSDFVFFTDADVHNQPGVLRNLVTRATADRRDLVSIMARLRTATGWERLLVPAFLYFFALLYPFRWVSGSGRTPAAAGGCLLVRRSALMTSGGLDAMRGAVIDDVTLAQQIARAGGQLWLGLDDGVRSLRPYDRLSDLWQMVARSAYTELDHSRVRLAGALAGLVLLFAVPLAGLLAGLLALSASSAAAVTLGMATAAWSVQTLSYLPTVRLHSVHPLWALALPAAGMLYAAMTASSALAHARGRGNSWKGRATYARDSVDT